MFRLFRITTDLSNKIVTLCLDYYNMISRASVISLILFFAAGLLGQIMKPLLGLSLLSMFIFMICEMILNIGNVLLSLRKFLGTGIVYWIIATLFMVILLLVILRNSSFLCVAIIYSLPFITWILYSLLASNKVAKIANFLLSSMYAIILLFKDLFMSFVDIFITETVEIAGYPCSYAQFFNLLANFIFTPILITNIIAMVLCELKGYWLEKYNNNLDVGEF